MSPVKISFHRSSDLAVKTQRKPGVHRAFVFEVQIGLSRTEVPPVDPLSGMLIPLVSVDEMLKDLALFWQQGVWSSVKELLEHSQEFLLEKTGLAGVVLEELCFKEKRGFWGRWKRADLSNGFSMGREVLLELEGHLYRLSFESPFEESSLEKHAVIVDTFQDFLSEQVFLKNPGLQVLRVQNMESGEEWILSAR